MCEHSTELETWDVRIRRDLQVPLVQILICWQVFQKLCSSLLQTDLVQSDHDRRHCTRDRRTSVRLSRCQNEESHQVLLRKWLSTFQTEYLPQNIFHPSQELTFMINITEANTAILGAGTWN